MHIVLEVTDGPHAGRSFTFDSHDAFLVGRASFAHFRLAKKDPFVSRVHFMVEVNPPHCRLMDMGSANGTFVNGQRVEEVDLTDGDQIRVAQTTIQISVTDDEPQDSQPDATDVASVAPTIDHVPGRPAREASEEDNDKALPTIEGYRLQRELGRGGMGVVYLALREADHSEVALKTIRPAVAASEKAVKRFLREAEILSRLRHDNIVQFEEMGQAGELLYFAMQYVPGTDARQLMKRYAPLSIGRAVGWVCQALAGLEYAHAEGFVHRDIKPSNLLISKEEGREVCRLADFGFAKVYHQSAISGLTMLNDVGGTIPYMPPEQITDFRNTQPPADQYAMAATLYHLLTGFLLNEFKDLPNRERLKQVLFNNPVPIAWRRNDIPKQLGEAIHRALAKDPQDRFPDVAALRSELAPFAALG